MLNEPKFIKVGFDLFCTWNKTPPDYRIYVNDELITERTFKWHPPSHLHEILQLRLVPGIYNIRIDSLDSTAVFNVRNTCIHYGTAKIINSTTLEIKHES